MRLHFIKYTFEKGSRCSNQRINVYDGSHFTAPLLHSFCNDVWPGDLMSSGNTVFVYYAHRDPEADAMFRINYTASVPSQGTINDNFNNSNEKCIALLENTHTSYYGSYI